MACFTKAQLGKGLQVLKVVVTVLIIKVGLGLFDVGSDIVGGYNFVSGGFKLALYFASLTREEFDTLPDLSDFGYLILCLPWLPGLLKITFLASDVNWRSLRWTEVLYRIGGFALLAVAWPVFSVLM